MTPDAEGAPDFDRLPRQRPKRAPDLTRLPPNSPESEQAILGCCLLDATAVGRCIEAFKGEDDWFYDIRNRTIFETLSSLYEERDPIDVITVSDRLKAFEKLEQVGGITYLAQLPDAVPSAANIDYYLGIVKDCWLRRKMITVATGVVSTMYELPEGNLPVALDKAESDILKVSESRVEQASRTIRTIVNEAMQEIENSTRAGGEPSGLRTGFVDYDIMTDGMHPGELIVLAARPGIGKSSLAMNIADYVAVETRLPVGVFSLEMTSNELGKRLICSRARVNARMVRRGYLAERDYPNLTTAAARIMSSPLYIDDQGGLSVLELRAKARRMFQQYGIKLFIIDYLQLMHGPENRRTQSSRQEEVAAISSGLKNLAKELKLPVIALAQLNREIERDKSRKPRLADLRESGAIEQDADVVTFLYRPGSSDEDEDPNSLDAVPINWLIAKQRNGPCGDVNLTFIKTITRFENAAKVSDQDEPEVPRASQMEIPT